MKSKRLFAKLFWALLGIAAMLLLMGTAQASAWSCIHGHSGHIEYPGRVVTMEGAHIGWGLDFDQESGLFNWVHFAVPTEFGKNTRYIALQLLTGSVDAIVDKVHIYDLNTKVREFNDLGWTGPLQVHILDLGAERAFAALGISIQVGAGVEMMDHRFLFTGACALQDDP